MTTVKKRLNDLINQEMSDEGAAYLATSLVNQLSEVPIEIREFLGKVQGVCLGVAISGKDHPNPDEVLMELFNEAQDILFPPSQ